MARRTKKTDRGSSEKRKSGRTKKRTTHERDNCKLTGLWETRREGLFTGNLDEDKIDTIIEFLERIKAGTGRGVILMFENENSRSDRDPDFNLILDEAEDREERPSRQGSRRRGKKIDEDSDNNEDDDDDDF